MARRSQPRSSSTPAPKESHAQQQRLQKVLAAAGISSRRECEELIREGRVEVDRQVVTELGYRLDPARHEIRVDGVVLSQPKRAYYVLNKPVGVVSTNRDPAGRPRVVDLVPPEPRVFPVGRLDRSSDGLILLTNDGDLANRLTHPRYGVEKTYAVRVAGQMTADTLLQLRKGVYLAEGLARVTTVKVKRRHKQSTDLEIVLKEGRNREIRRILARVGHKVLQLTRTAVGPLRLGDLPPGAYRRLTSQQIRQLERSAAEAEREEQPPRRGRRAGPRASQEKSRGGRKKPPVRPRKPDVSKPGSILEYDEGDERAADTGAVERPRKKRPAKRTKAARPHGKGRQDARGQRKKRPAKRRKKGT